MRIRHLSLLLAVAVIAFAGAVFAMRGEIRDAFGRWQRGPVPPAVSRADAEQQGQDAEQDPTTTQPTPAANTNADANTNANTNSGAGTVANVNGPKTAPKPTTNTNVAPAKPEPQKPAPPVTTPPAKASYNLSVLFIPQAPFKKWDAVDEDACEEASMLMLKAYMDDVTSMSLEEMSKRIKEIMDYESKTYHPDAWISTNAEENVATMQNFLKMKGARAIPLNSIDDVKREIAKGHPVMLPADGKALKNPNFKNGGPVYHMLVAKGYTPTTIVTNDPGTRLGADYAYKDEVLWDAIHDWNGGDVPNGKKVMIVAE